MTTAAVLTAGCVSKSDGTPDFSCRNATESNFETSAVSMVYHDIEQRDGGYEGVVPLKVEPNTLDTVEVRSVDGGIIETEQISGEDHELRWDVDELPSDYTVTLVGLQDGDEVDSAEIHFSCEHP